MNKLKISTTVTAPETPESVYETSAVIHPGDSVKKLQIINLLEGHLSLLNAELTALKESK